MRRFSFGEGWDKGRDRGKYKEDNNLSNDIPRTESGIFFFSRISSPVFTVAIFAAIT